MVQVNGQLVTLQEIADSGAISISTSIVEEGLYLESTTVKSNYCMNNTAAIAITLFNIRGLKGFYVFSCELFSAENNA